MTDIPGRQPGGHHGSRLRGQLRTVRVRITATAAVVTAVAVGVAGWLLVRSVEDTQLSQARQEITDELDRVTAALEGGVTPETAVQGSTWSPWIRVQDGSGQVVAHRNAPSTVVSVHTDEDTGTAPVPSDDMFASDTAVARGTAGEVTAAEMPPPAAGAQDLEVEVGVIHVDELLAESGTGQVTVAETGPSAGAADLLPDETEFQVGGVVTRFTAVTETVDTPSGALTVSAAVPVEQVARGVDALRQALILGVPALVLLVALIAWVLVGRALRPVESIRTEVEGITGTTMHRRVPEPPTGDEIGRLARTMNAMLGRLDRAATRQREFVADASHELRSPVATIRTRLEVARAHPDQADWPAVADKVLAEEARLEALIDDLLLLASHEEQREAAGDDPPEGSGVDAPGLTSDLAEIVSAEAERPRHLPVTVLLPDTGGEADAGAGGPSSPGVAGNPGRLERVVANLLDNATRYSTSTVEVRVETDSRGGRAGGLARLIVDDDGPGIPEADRERVFERFTRLDQSRARDLGGAGLGLAVVRSVVAAQGGRVRVEDSPLGGTRFVVELPVVVTTGAGGQAGQSGSTSGRSPTTPAADPPRT